MEVVILNENGDSVGNLEIVDEIFKSEVNNNLLYEAIKNELANRRQGTHSTKTRAEVSGGGKKPWRQKGTGRARAGSTRSPIWVGGGKTHTPKPRDYSYRLPKKMKRKALLPKKKNRRMSRRGYTRSYKKAIIVLDGKESIDIVK